ncbi:MAG: hypothetical protein AAF358_18670 [Pseudomonadota bacterium]
MSTSEEPRIQQWLHSLPEREPPAHLWPRIVESALHRQQRRAARNGWLAAGAVAAALVMALSLGIVLGQRSAVPPVEVASVSAPELLALMERTEQLERALREQRSEFARLASTQQQLVRTQQAQLIVLDQALAQAYARNEPEETLARLWQRRVDLMANLVSIYDTTPGAGSV